MQNFGHENFNYKTDHLNATTEVSEIQDRSLPQVPGVRPMVDPHAEGNVDPDLYPKPKEATHKIRGKNDFIEYVFGAVDQELLTVKTFYFFFYSAFGSLFPLMGVYFKQMGMNAGQCGLLIGLRPLIEFLSAPFWGSWADRWQKGKLILLASLSCWIIFTLPLGFIQPPATSCMISKNHTYYLYVPETDQRVMKRSVVLKETLNPASLDFMNRIQSSQNIAHEKHNNNFSTKNYTGNEMTSQQVSKMDIDKYADVKEPKNKLPLKTLIRNFRQKKNCIEINMLKQAHQNIEADIKFVPANVVRPDLLSFQSLEELSKDNEELKQDFQKYNVKILSLNKKLLKRATILHHSNGSLLRKKRNTKLQMLSTGQSPLPVNYAANYNEREHKEWVTPAFSSIVYRLPDIQKTFFLLLLLIIVGEFFSAPAITLADSAVITLLGEDADRYGHQRMFGSLGWGLAMFFVGIALDHSTAFPEHPCNPDPKEKNYTICFATFSVLMGAALITATQINFKYDTESAEPKEVDKLPVELTKEEQLQNQLSQQLNLPGLQDSLEIDNYKKSQLLEDKTKMFAQTTREIPEWITVLKQFKDLKCASFLFVAWFMGFGIGLIFTFLFWHLQDYDGTPTLFGVASVINHISEIFAYFFSFKLIRQMGHVKVLCLGLGGNVLRFLYISWLKNPWWVLPFEFMQGITHAAVWAACCSYIAHNTPTPLRSSAQGVLQGLHHGLGRGCGAVIGGMFVDIYGTTATFRAYGLICLVILAGFIFINFYRKDTGFVSDLPQTEDPHQVAEVTHLAPHGVPSNAIPRALSSNRLHELGNTEPSYGATYQTSSGGLNIPGGSEGPINPNNPFLNGISEKSYNYTFNFKNDDEFIRRSFQNYSDITGTDFEIIKIPPITTHVHIQQPCTNPFHQHNYDW